MNSVNEERGDRVSEVDVVVIDDDEGVRWVLQQMLAVQNISCSAARNGPEGISVVSRQKPRLAIVDIKLGAMNGLDVARSICKDNRDLKILFVTGYNETIKGKVEPELPVLGIVEKPFDVAELLRLVRQGLDGAPAA
jgi:two-component system, OmpR family, KDP operon response regulator KdpE